MSDNLKERKVSLAAEVVEDLSKEERMLFIEVLSFERSNRHLEHPHFKKPLYDTVHRLVREVGE